MIELEALTQRCTASASARPLQWHVLLRMQNSSPVACCTPSRGLLSASQPAYIAAHTCRCGWAPGRAAARTGHCQCSCRGAMVASHTAWGTGPHLKDGVAAARAGGASGRACGGASYDTHACAAGLLCSRWGGEPAAPGAHVRGQPAGRQPALGLGEAACSQWRMRTCWDGTPVRALPACMCWGCTAVALLAACWWAAAHEGRCPGCGRRGGRVLPLPRMQSNHAVMQQRGAVNAAAFAQSLWDTGGLLTWAGSSVRALLCRCFAIALPCHCTRDAASKPLKLAAAAGRACSC